MIFYKTEELAKIIQGKILKNPYPQAEIKNIATDSRSITDEKETIFFALLSSRNNGHNYLPGLAKKRLLAVVVSQIPKDLDIFKNTAVIKVDNTLNALQQLAIFHRRNFKYPVIGITGSNGKTIIKEWLFDLLNENFTIIRSPKSYNSQIGVPISIWLMNNKHNLAIFEAGISMSGEMEKLEEIIFPDIGIYTNTGSAHQENFKDFKQKTNEKLTLFKNSKKLVFSADQEETSILADRFCENKKIEKINWSLKGNPALIQFTAEIKHSTSIIAQVNYSKFKFSILFNDSSSIENACHCFAAVFATEVTLDDICKKFNKLTTIAMRLEIKQGKNNCLLINDYYNSDINALSIALSTLKNQALKGHLKKILILSDIKQSGIKPEELYSLVNKMVEKADVNQIIGIGPDLISVNKVFQIEKEFYSDTKTFLNQINHSEFNNSAILIKGAREFRFEKISEALQEKAHQTILEIDMNAIVDNLNSFKLVLKPETKIMAMVKAFSYGSGTSEIAKLLQFNGIGYLAVAVADEGVDLRRDGINSPIIVMNPEAHSFQNIIDFNLEPNIYSLSLLNEFSKIARYNALINYPVHIKIDTGMNRLGFKTENEIIQVIDFIKESGNLKVSSVFSHLVASDDPTLDSFTKDQIKRFEFLSSRMAEELDYKILKHILNSAGIERFSEYQFDMVRLGIGLYGISSIGTELKNISTLKTSVSQIKIVDRNETVGYNRKGIIFKPSKIAIIPIGYADGLSRSLGNMNGRAFVNGTYVSIIGNVCMDMC
ncbi:MAG: bifunctional UDP-N-acetylmuramoyl-tripeptide:D-alanyl-D-alanine ligase/alanine racemase, partial [Mariniphaga sp.]|nr:bifunctional UDP-N-acetylmuramoyl-tripeptide:D-alanyl-D-alanine ligase/alanine racemase [Mariniphaga sp.]